MRILFICDFLERNHLRNIFTKNNIAANENLIFVSSFSEAEDFIVNFLFSNKQHIDLIITGDKLINNNLNIDFELLQKGYYHILNPYYHLKIKSDPKYWASRTAILSENFINSPRILNYNWLEDNLIEMEQHIDRYEDIIKNLTRYNKVNS